MHIWAIANQKGGVGKTTTAAALGGLLASEGHATLLVDMDAHASLSGYFGIDAPPGGGSYALFADGAHRLRDEIQRTRFERLHLLPAAPALATIDRQFGARPGMGRVLAEALAEVAGLYEYVLIDGPPTLGVPMVNALAACTLALLPTQTEFLALRGLERMLQTLAMLERSRGAPIPRLILPTLFDARTHASVACLRTLSERHGPALARTTIPADTQLREASHAGVPAGAWPGARRGGDAYRALLGELRESEPVSAKVHRA